MKSPNEFRVRSGTMSSTDAHGSNGAFRVPFENRILSVIASDGEGWDHVSVSLPNRCPNWREMCFLKNMFWGAGACVIQYHPSEIEYVNNHEYCLHMWRPQKVKFPVPPTIMVGIR